MSKPKSEGRGKPSAVYVVDTPAGTYAGRTEIGQGETPRQAVKARLDEHIRDDSALGSQIKSAESAVRRADITEYPTKKAAAEAERVAYDKIPKTKRLNERRPPKR